MNKYDFFLFNSVAQNLVVLRTSPAVRKRKTSSHSLPAHPSRARDQPTVALSWMTRHQVTSQWMKTTSYLATLLAGAWMKCVSSFLLFKVSVLMPHVMCALCSPVYLRYHLLYSFIVTSLVRLWGLGIPVPVTGDWRAGAVASQRRASHVHYEHQTWSCPQNLRFYQQPEGLNKGRKERRCRIRALYFRHQPEKLKLNLMGIKRL